MTVEESATRQELLRLAQKRGVRGRSGMTKQQLLSALQESESPGEPDGAGGSREPVQEEGNRQITSRVESFRLLAEARARGEMVLIPRMLSGNDRRVHVRETLREDHETRIASHHVEAQDKFDKLAGSCFQFFRGTALLFYRDVAGEDARLPTVLAVGDVHPGNFGLMPNADNVPVFGVNDFDEADYAPFTWDLKRGAVGFMLAAEAKGGHGAKKQRAIARQFVRGYVDAISSYAASRSENDEQLRIDNAPGLVADLIDGALETTRARWLAESYLNPSGSGFRTDDEIVPVTARQAEFQELIEEFVRVNEVDVPERAAALRVKDVAERKGAGTASLGLTRYYLLIEGPQADGTDDLLLEFKQARRSALSGLVPPSDYRHDGRGDRIRHAQHVHLVHGDVFFGSLDFEGKSFMLRERAPYRDEIDLKDLSTSEWKDYAAICGRVLARSHALSDDIGSVDYDVEPAIVDAIASRDLFVDDILRFADEGAARVRRDHEHFVADHRLGAFRSIDVVYP